MPGRAARKVASRPEYFAASARAVCWSKLVKFCLVSTGGTVRSKLSLKMILVGIAAASAVACGGAAVPQETLTAAQASVKGAEVGGANEDPKAQLHLKLANEQIDKAKKLIEDGKNEEAARMIDRAQSDADLALVLAQEAKAMGEAKDADEQLGKLKKKINQ
jgi:hypothetical protein